MDNTDLIFAFAEYYAGFQKYYREHHLTVRQAFDKFLPTYTERLMADKDIRKIAESVITAITQETGLRRKDIFSLRHLHEISEAKQIFAYIMREKSFTPREIAEYLRHNRTTVFNRISKAEDLLCWDKQFQEKVSRIMGKL